MPCAWKYAGVPSTARQLLGHPAALHPQPGMGVEEAPQVRHDVQPRERHRPADAQSADQASTGSACQQIGLVRFLDRAQRPLVERLTGLGRCQPARGSHQQPRIQPRFQLGNRLGYRRLADMKSSCRRGKRA